VGPNDVVLLDQQVHASVQMAAQLLKANHLPVERIQHSNLEKLENQILKLKDKHDKIWYMADGVYSMYGDAAPAKELGALLDQYEQFYLYVDDAHGMSWTGKNGTGYFLNQFPLHPKIYFTASLSKAFGGAGGLMVLPDERTKNMVELTGTTQIFSGPIQPPMLGADIALAKIHLGQDLPLYQQELAENIQFFINCAKVYQIPLASEEFTPVFYVKIGISSVSMEIVKTLMERGFYTNICMFPAVPTNNEGIRITINRKHQKRDIESLLANIADLLPKDLLQG
jgi:7-keto-8-aminopelargonate synthetase-like enzyme